MSPQQPAHSIIWLKDTVSTNYAIREFLPELDNLSVVAAHQQTKGRGQGNHSWHSLPGENLTFSILLKFNDLPATESVRINHIIAVAIREYLRRKGVQARIKHPNDIWVGEKKICGILIENSIREKHITHSIVGIGLNINQVQWPEDLPNPVSLSELTGERYDLKCELEALQKEICRCFELSQSTDGRISLQEEFKRYLFFLENATSVR